MAPPSKPALEEVTNRNHATDRCPPPSVRRWGGSNRQKTATSSRKPPLLPPPPPPPQTGATSIIPSTKPFSQASNVHLKNANECDTTSNSTSEAHVSGDGDRETALVAATTTAKNETAEWPKQKVANLKEETLHPKAKIFELMKELHYAYSLFVVTGYRCAELESENKKLRHEQASLQQELMALKTKNSKSHGENSHDDESDSDDKTTFSSTSSMKSRDE